MQEQARGTLDVDPQTNRFFSAGPEKAVERDTLDV
jgi:hypothetical protein